MPLYFFDTNDGNSFDKDEEGVELAGPKAARLQAQRALADMAHDVVPDDDLQKTITAHVWDERGDTVLRASLVLTVKMGPAQEQFP